MPARGGSDPEAGLVTRHRHPKRTLTLPPDGPWLLLADIRAMLRPRETLVVVPITPSDSWEFLTFPLPAKDDALSCQMTAVMVAATLRQFPDADQIFVATFSDRAAVRPVENVQFTVIMRVHQDDIHLMGSYYASETGWGSYMCDHPECAGPRPLEELERGATRLTSLGELEP